MDQAAGQFRFEMRCGSLPSNVFLDELGREACENPRNRELVGRQARSISMGISFCFALYQRPDRAAAGLRYKVFVLVPIALLIALGSAAVLHMNDFRTESGIATITACLVLKQAAYMIVQIFAPTAHLISDDEADSVPSSGREKAVHGNNGDNGNQKPSQFAAFARFERVEKPESPFWHDR